MQLACDGVDAEPVSLISRSFRQQNGPASRPKRSERDSFGLSEKRSPPPTVTPTDPPRSHTPPARALGPVRDPAGAGERGRALRAANLLVLCWCCCAAHAGQRLALGAPTRASRCALCDALSEAVRAQRTQLHRATHAAALCSLNRVAWLNARRHKVRGRSLSRASRARDEIGLPAPSGLGA